MRYYSARSVEAYEKIEQVGEGTYGEVFMARSRDDSSLVALKKVKLEERLYRHRCVEAWSMTVPWAGFPMKRLVEFAKPLGSAKYVVMQTFQNPEMASGQKQYWYPWPYTEGLTVAEATN